MGCQTRRFVYEYVLEHYGDDGDLRHPSVLQPKPAQGIFYAADVETLESVEFPTEPSASINFSRTTNNHNATVEFDNVADTKNGSLTFNVEHNF